MSNTQQRPRDAVRTGRGRAWVFTINNYTKPQEKYIAEVLYEAGKCQYLIAGRETGENGTNHLQGYVYFDCAKSAARVQSLLCPRGDMTGAWHALARGNPTEATAYCRKENNLLVETGTLPRGVGRCGGPIEKRADNPDGLNAKLLEFQRDAKKGIKQAGLWEKHASVMIRYTSGCAKMVENYMNQGTKPVPTVFVLWGGTGTGKSHWVMDSFGRDTSKVYWVTCGGGKIWWGGYEQQQAVVFDDFQAKNMDMQLFKLITDKYSCRVEPKGAQYPLTAKYYIFTTNENPDKWYRDPSITEEHEDAHYLACQRRIKDGVMHFTRKYDANDNSYHCGFLPHIPVQLKQEVIDLTEEDDEDEPSVTVHDSEAADDDDDDNDNDRPTKRARVTPSASRFVDLEAGCDDDDDDDDEDDNEDEFADFIED